MRCSALLLYATLTACASGGTQSTGARPETMRIVGGGGTGAATTVGMQTSNAAIVARIPRPIDQVWRLLPAAYDSLRIPLTTVDAAKHLIGNEGMKIRQRLGSVSLSQYIDCGQAQIGPSADSYDVYLNVTTTVRATSATESELATIVESAARPIAFSQEYSRCTSKGQIESRIAAIVNGKLAGQK